MAHDQIIMMISYNNHRFLNNKYKNVKLNLGFSEKILPYKSVINLLKLTVSAIIFVLHLL